jgi:hypothetical protein
MYSVLLIRCTKIFSIFSVKSKFYIHIAIFSEVLGDPTIELSNGKNYHKIFQNKSPQNYCDFKEFEHCTNSLELLQQII